jgi:type III secretion protein W
MLLNGNVRVDNAALNQGGLQNTAADRPALQGSLSGLKLTVSNSPEALLADAAEELTFALDNTKELDLKERQEKKSIDPKMIERVKLYQELMLQTDQRDRLDALASALKNSNNAQDVLEQAKKFFPDPADAWAALSEIADRQPDDGQVSSSLIKEALEALDLEAGPVIRASMAGALAGAEFSDLDSPLALKNDYVRVAIDFSAALDMLGHILERFGADGFDRGVDFLLKALAADLAAEIPSRDKASLENVAGQLGQVRTLNGIRYLGQKLVDRWRSVHGQTDSKLTDMDYLKFVLEGQKVVFPTEKLADPLVALAKPPDIEMEVLFRQDLLNSTKSIATQTFEDQERRERFVGAIQDGLDFAIAREDEWLASMEADN